VTRRQLRPHSFLRHHQTQGDRHGQRSAEGQSGVKETQEGEGQGHCRRAKPKGRDVAADPLFRQKEIAGVGRLFDRVRNAADAELHGPTTLLRGLGDLVLQVAGLMIAAELAQRRLVQLKQNLAEFLGFGIASRKILAVHLT